jgi:hypothetical protein
VRDAAGQDDIADLLTGIAPVSSHTERHKERKKCT